MAATLVVFHGIIKERDTLVPFSKVMVIETATPDILEYSRAVLQESKRLEAEEGAILVDWCEIEPHLIALVTNSK